MTAGLVTAVPSFAAEVPAPSASALPATDRGRAVGFWKLGGPAVKAAAEVALLGSDADVRRFLDTDRAAAEVLDDRQLALQVVSIGGREVREAAKKALAGTPAELSAFLKDGWKVSQERDDRQAVVRAINAGGPAVAKAGRTAFDGTPQDARTFLEQGQYRMREQDDRVLAAQAISAGGAQTKAAGRIAFNGTPDEVRDFLEVGQFVAQARDAEYASISQLAAQVETAGAQAKASLTQAKEEADRAIDAARLAREAAAKAAAETEAAKGDATKAAAASARAAEATRRAAQASQTAATAARAAVASSRRTANAASRANSAMVGALQEAAKTLAAAAAVSWDKTKITEAQEAAGKATRLANEISGVSGWTRATAEADAAYQVTIELTKDANDQANQAATSADASAAFAEQAKAPAAEARAAAAVARRNSAESSRAATAAQALSADSSRAAKEAADAAASAADRLRAAAEAATWAWQHAGESSAAADRSKAQADAAKVAADAASSAVEKQKSLRDLATRTEAEDLATRTVQGINQANDLRVAEEERQAALQKDVDDARQLDADATRLAAEAAQTGADEQQIAAKGRRMAVAAMKTRGPWSKSAAEFALADTDAVVAEYARTGWAQAAERDERTRVQQIIRENDSGDPAAPDPIATAATTALKGDAAAVHAFLTTGQYDVQAADLRVRVVQVLNAGGPSVHQAGKNAFDNGASTVLADFLSVGQYRARATDDRVLVSRAMSSGTPEVKAAARIAFDGPLEAVRSFVETGQYKAQQKDQLTAHHNAAIDQMIAQSAGTAATAQQNAAEAFKVAALARNAANEANDWATSATKSENQASIYAGQARASAGQAADAAAKAAESAKKARQSAAQAQQAANSAASSARWATASERAASKFAEEAGKKAIEARTSAEALGKSKQEIFTLAALASNAMVSAQMDRQEWEKEFDKALSDFSEARAKKSGFTALDGVHLLLDTLGTIPVLGEPMDLLSCGIYGIEKKYVDAGLSCASAIPIAGYSATAVKFGKWGEKGADLLSGINRERKAVSAAGPTTSCFDSFPAGTGVLMADRSIRPIEQVTVGDSVLATDPITGRTESKPVQATIRTPDDRGFTTVQLDSSGSGTVISTDHHRYWTENQRSWRDASQLRPGDTLRTPNGAAVTVASVSHDDSSRVAYNLTVGDLHTYYVVAATTPVLVHNRDLSVCDLDFRPPNLAHPPVQSVLDVMPTLPIHIYEYDCSEIAARLLREAGGVGKIIEGRVDGGGWIDVPEGRVTESYIFHQVYTDGRYVYDPRLSMSAIPAGDYFKLLKKLNPGIRWGRPTV
ncbi:hypothetical protein GCM10020229_62920 [Kitasatospora albolonga]|uniref:polymorphic toxin-type HINT domain-containing protein n=1 Tax=Kitasatospora albolonga TaxID=68173 RepID=UPI0031EF1CCE